MIMTSKIKQLMIESGLSEEAAAKICESLDSYVSEKEHQLDEQFKQRLVKAKKVCMEEVESHNLELSRRAQIFMESKREQIIESLRKQIANEETEAVACLSKISSLMEGIDVNGQPNSELMARIKKLANDNKRLMEDRDKAVQKANSTLELANKVSKHNRDLERQLQESKRQGNGGNIAEGKGKNQQPSRRIDESKTPGTTTRTTRRTVASNQGANRPLQQQGSAVVGPAQIAESMEEDV